ncbi:MAG: YIP1 family protein [Candidatus Obscuribacterales bacterium]|nr:YIP1 family protein [Candidatus Obscuribacterales bacterium]
MTEETLGQAPAHTQLGFIDTFMGTLVAPVQTFKKLSEDCSHEINHLPGALAIVVLVFAMDALRLTPAKHVGWALFNIPSEVTGGLTLWVLSAAVVGLTALCFGAPMSKLRAAFVTLAWSLLPWIFMGPIACFNTVLGNANVLFMGIPLVWILVLQIIAVKQSFDMKVWQALVLFLVVPPLLSWYQFMQLLQGLAATIGSLLAQ